MDARLLRFRTDPGSEDACALARGLAAEGRLRDASDVLEAHLSIAPQDYEAYLEAARLARTHGELLEAQKLLLVAAKLQPRRADAFLLLVEVLLARGDGGRATRVLAKAQSLAPDHPDLPRVMRLAEQPIPRKPPPMSSHPPAAKPKATKLGAPAVDPRAFGRPTAPQAQVPRGKPKPPAPRRAAPPAAPPAPDRPTAAHPKVQAVPPVHARPTSEHELVVPDAARRSDPDGPLGGAPQRPTAPDPASARLATKPSARPSAAGAAPGSPPPRAEPQVRPSAPRPSAPRPSAPRPSAPRPSAPGAQPLATLPKQGTDSFDAVPTSLALSPETLRLLEESRPDVSAPPADAPPVGAYDDEDDATVNVDGLSELLANLDASDAGAVPQLSRASEGQAPLAAPPSPAERTVDVRAPTAPLKAAGPVGSLLGFGGVLESDRPAQTGGHGAVDDFTREDFGDALPPDLLAALADDLPTAPARGGESDLLPEPARAQTGELTFGDPPTPPTPADLGAVGPLGTMENVAADGTDTLGELPQEDYPQELIDRYAGAMDKPTLETPILSAEERAERERDPRPGPGEREDVDRVIAALERTRFFDSPEGEAWEGRGRFATLVGGRVFAAIWALALAALAAGYGGYRWWYAGRAEALDEVAGEAAELLVAGDAADVAAAFELLDSGYARTVPHDGIQRLRLYARVRQSVDEGRFDTLSLRSELARAAQVGTTGALVDAADACIAISEGRRGDVQGLWVVGSESPAADRPTPAPADPGDPTSGLSAAALVRRAVGSEGEGPFPGLAQHALGRLSWWLAPRRVRPAILGETEGGGPGAALLDVVALDWIDDDLDAASDRVGAVLREHGNHLRALIWRQLLTSEDDSSDPTDGLAALDALAGRVASAATLDTVLVELTRARLLARSGEREGAGDALRRALRAGGEEPPNIDPLALRLIANQALTLRFYETAERAIRRVLHQSPDLRAERLRLASLHLARGEFRPALRLLAMVPADEPRAVYLGARAAVQLGTRSALEAAAASLGEHGEGSDPEGRELWLRIRAGLGETQEAMNAARAWARDEPGELRAHRALGYTARRASARVTAWERAQEIAPADPETKVGLGQALLASEPERAERILREAFGLQPGMAAAEVALGQLMLASGRAEEALALFQERHLRSQRYGGDAWANTAFVGMVQANLELGDLERADRLVAGYEGEATREFRRVAAEVALGAGRFEDAVAELSEVVVDGSSIREDAELGDLCAYGEALEATGRAREAGDIFARAIDLDSRSICAVLGRARSYLRAERPSAAEDLLERLQGLDEGVSRPAGFRADLLLLEGRIMLLEGDRADAAPVLREASEAEGCAPATFFFLGEALAGTDSSAARSAYLRYLEEAPEGPFAARAERAIGGE